MTIFASLPYSFVNGTIIDATQMMADLNQIVANGNANAAANGSNSDITALTGLLAPPTGAGSLPFYATVIGGTANAITASTTLPTGFTLRAGNLVWLKPTAVNTGATTVAVGGTTATAINKTTPAGLAALSGGELIANMPVLLLYDGTRYIILSVVQPAATAAVVKFASANNAATPNTKLDYSASAATLVSAAGTGVRHTSVSGTIDATVTGANGIDTGALANSTWYYVYLISNGTTIAGLLSASATTPTLPSGYIYSVRVGAIVTDGSAHFMRVKQLGQVAQYVVTTATNTANMPQMDSGVKAAWTAVAVGSFVPTTAVRILGAAYTNSARTVEVAPNNNYGDLTSTTNPPPSGHAGIQASGAFDLMLESTNIYWGSNDASNGLFCRGWVDSVPVC